MPNWIRREHCKITYTYTRSDCMQYYYFIIFFLKTTPCRIFVTPTCPDVRALELQQNCTNNNRIRIEHAIVIVRCTRTSLLTTYEFTYYFMFYTIATVEFRNNSFTNSTVPSSTQYKNSTVFFLLFIKALIIAGRHRARCTAKSSGDIVHNSVFDYNFFFFLSYTHRVQHFMLVEPACKCFTFD